MTRELQTLLAGGAWGNGWARGPQGMASGVGQSPWQTLVSAAFLPAPGTGWANSWCSGWPPHPSSSGPGAYVSSGDPEVAQCPLAVPPHPSPGREPHRQGPPLNASRAEGRACLRSQLFTADGAVNGQWGDSGSCREGGQRHSLLGPGEPPARGARNLPGGPAWAVPASGGLCGAGPARTTRPGAPDPSRPSLPPATALQAGGRGPRVHGPRVLIECWLFARLPLGSTEPPGGPGLTWWGDILPPEPRAVRTAVPTPQPPPRLRERGAPGPGQPQPAPPPWPTRGSAVSWPSHRSGFRPAPALPACLLAPSERPAVLVLPWAWGLTGKEGAATGSGLGVWEGQIGAGALSTSPCAASAAAHLQNLLIPPAEALPRGHERPGPSPAPHPHPLCLRGTEDGGLSEWHRPGCVLCLALRPRGPPRRGPTSCPISARAPAPVRLHQHRLLAVPSTAASLVAGTWHLTAASRFPKAVPADTSPWEKRPPASCV
ncbi:translation initiation factor IF-2-like [Lemur catta]|uniref:translation initiation factor IF-2-like n=1 Tax=Lemur catta TaxID=9447 RepID=UPI001E26D27D|nr:translation initiation factor IF-2-like [Lemur catta]